jgi:hypothetical protein
MTARLAVAVFFGIAGGALVETISNLIEVLL